MPEVIIVVGLGFGDEGKGSIVDYLVRSRNAKTVVRYNGGSQAAHTVVEASGRTHTFAQFGSGTLVPGVRTHLSRHMKIDPLNMMVEDAALRQIGVTDAFDRTTIDSHALIITPFQKIANRLREAARGEGRHGSCGLGVGETQADSDRMKFVRAGWLRSPELLTLLLREMQTYKREQLEGEGLLSGGLPLMNVFTDSGYIRVLVDRYTEFLRSGVQIVEKSYLGDALADTVIFEGAQGILLDQDVGFHPYTTWSRTTTRCAEELLHLEGYTGSVTRLGVQRAYMTRHGPGPFVTEDKGLTDMLPDSHNAFGIWQRGFRVGWPDIVMARYAVAANHGLDAIAVTNMDRWQAVPDQKVCMLYDFPGQKNIASLGRYPPDSLGQCALLTERLAGAAPFYYPASGDDYLGLLSTCLHTPIAVISYGPTAGDKKEA